MTVSDLVAQFLAEKECHHALVVSGAGNIRLLDAIHRLGKTALVACHSEQSCCQAAIGYYRCSERIAPVVFTMGGGAGNAVTGIVSAWMDSIPLFLIGGTENHYYRPEHGRLRAHGVQSFNLCETVRGITNAAHLMNVHNLITPIACLTSAYAQLFENRPGPVVIEIPIDVQGAHA